MKTFFLNQDQARTTFEVRSDELASPGTSRADSGRPALGKSVRFTVTPSTSTVSLSLAPNAIARELQTERINKSMVLGYMPALNNTRKR